MAFKRALIQNIQKFSDETGAPMSIIVSVQVFNTKDEVMTEDIVITVADLGLPASPTGAQKRKAVLTAIKNAIRANYAEWARKRGLSDTEAVLNDKADILSDLGSVEITSLT